MVSYISLYYARGALSAVTLVASFVMWIVSMVKSKSNRDPARSAFLWQKIAFGFFALFCLFDAALYLWLPFYRGYGYYSNNIVNVILSYLGTLWYNIADILIFMALVRLNNGIAIMQAKQPNSLPKIFKNIAWGAFGILTILAVVLFAVAMAYSFIYTYATWYNLALAYYSLIFVASIMNLAQTIYVFIIAHKESHLAQPAIYALVCAILYLMHQLYELILVADLNIQGSHNIITEVVFSFWPMFIILILIYVLGSSRTSPLSSNAVQQPATFTPATAGAPGTQPIPAFYTVNGVNYAVQPPVMQQAYMPAQPVPQQAYAAPQQYPQQPYSQQPYAQQPYAQQPYQAPPPGQGMYMVPPELSSPNSYGQAGHVQQQSFAGVKAEDSTPSPPSVDGAHPPPHPPAPVHQ